MAITANQFTAIIIVVFILAFIVRVPYKTEAVKDRNIFCDGNGQLKLRTNMMGLGEVGLKMEGALACAQYKTSRFKIECQQGKPVITCDAPIKDLFLGGDFGSVLKSYAKSASEYEPLMEDPRSIPPKSPGEQKPTPDVSIPSGPWQVCPILDGCPTAALTDWRLPNNDYWFTDCTHHDDATMLLELGLKGDGKSHSCRNGEKAGENKKHFYCDYRFAGEVVSEDGTIISPDFETRIQSVYSSNGTLISRECTGSVKEYTEPTPVPTPTPIPPTVSFDDGELAFTIGEAISEEHHRVLNIKDRRWMWTPEASARLAVIAEEETLTYLAQYQKDELDQEIIAVRAWLEEPTKENAETVYGKVCSGCYAAEAVGAISGLERDAAQEETKVAESDASDKRAIANSKCSEANSARTYADKIKTWTSCFSSHNAFMARYKPGVGHTPAHRITALNNDAEAKCNKAKDDGMDPVCVEGLFNVRYKQFHAWRTPANKVNWEALEAFINEVDANCTESRLAPEEVANDATAKENACTSAKNTAAKADEVVKKKAAEAAGWDAPDAAGKAAAKSAVNAITAVVKAAGDVHDRIHERAESEILTLLKPSS